MSKNQLIHIYSGTEIQVIMLKGLLDDVNVQAIVQNDFRSGVMAGFGQGTVSTIRLMILESDLEKARPVLDEFASNNLESSEV